MKKKFLLISTVLFAAVSVEMFLSVATSTLLDKAIEYKDAPIANSIMALVFVLTLAIVVFAAMLLAFLVCECTSTESKEQNWRDKNIPIHSNK